MGYYVNPSAESFAAIARSKSGFYQYCKSNIKQKKNTRSINKDCFYLSGRRKTYCFVCWSRRKKFSY